MADFHFLRPFWLLLLLALPILPWMWRRIQQRHSGWETLIPSPLLQPLVRDQKSEPVRLNALWPALLLLAAAVALAGPSWRRAPTPLQQQNDSLVVVMDMSNAMLATDVKPSRLVRAKQKLRDLLQSRRGALTALVVYAGDAHVVTPLTDDNRTIATMLPAVTPSIMPSAGHRADLGVARAIQLIRQGAPGPAHILLMTDRVKPNAARHIEQALKGTPYRLDVLIVGTTDGGPIPLSGKGFLRNHGKIVMAKADPAGLTQLAEKTGGHAHGMTLNDDDLDTLGVTGKQSGGWQSTKSHLKASLWQDDGYWLLWLILPIGLLCWRRGALLLIPLMVMPLVPAPAHASAWSRLWETPNQQGYTQFSHNPKAAARLFSDPAWKGAALYRAGKYRAAAKAFAAAKGAQADYNRGNALARAGQLQKAIDAYDAALKAQPDMKDARDNRALVKKLLKQQKKNRQKGKNGQSGSQNHGKGKSGNQSGKHTGSGNSSHPNGQGKSGSGKGQRSGQHQDNANRDNNRKSGKPNQQDNGSRQGSSEDTQHRQQGGKKSGENKGAQTASGNSQQEKKGANNGQKGLAGKPPSGDKLSQSDQQWLRRVPDDPSGLLRRKFLYQYQQQQNENSQSGGDAPW